MYRNSRIRRRKESWRICERDLGVGELPALRSFVPNIGEARLLLEALAVIRAGDPHPPAEDHRAAEVADEWRLDGVGIGVAARVTHQVDQSGLVGDAAVC